VTAVEAYRLLGLAPGCSERDLVRRFRHLARQTHPDVGGSNEQFTKLAHAYTVAAAEHLRPRDEAEVTTHINSTSGRLRRLRRIAQRRLHQLTAPHHTSPDRGHQ
jgi:DnaJ-class molecular chaperone